MPWNTPSREARIGDALGPFHAAVSLLITTPGLREPAARVVVAEIGDDMSRFPRRGIWSRGRACVRGWMKAQADVDPLERDAARPG
jgi:hypothetical protein